MIFHKPKKDILNGFIPQQILLITIPIAGTYLLQLLYQCVDYLVLGRFAGVEAMAAVGGSATMIINILLNIIIGIATGVMIIVAQNYGSRNDDNVHEAVRTGMFVAIVFTGIISLICGLIAKPLLIKMGCPSNVIKPSLIYMIFYLVGLIPYAIYTFGMYILRATGDTKISLLFTIIIAVVKIILDILLTAIFNLGVWGVSIATLMSYLVCGVVVLIILNKTELSYHYDFSEFGFDFSTLKHIFKIGVPVAVQGTMFTITNALVSIKVNEFGTSTIAAFGAYNNVDNFYWCFDNAVGSAIITIVGQNYGNKKMKRVKETFIHGIVLLIIGTLIIACLQVVFGRQVLGLFTKDQEVVEIAYETVRDLAYLYPLYILVETVSSTIKGCGDARSSMVISIITICIVRILYLTFAELNGLTSIIFAYPFSWGISSVIYLLYFLLNKKYRLNQND